MTVLYDTRGQPIMSEAMAVRKLKGHCEAWAAMVIAKAYPGHMFMIDFDVNDLSYRVDHHLMKASGKCMYVHPGEPDIEKGLVRSAGEILERLNIPRRKLEDYEQYAEAAPRAKEAFACR